MTDFILAGVVLLLIVAVQAAADTRRDCARMACGCGKPRRPTR